MLVTFAAIEGLTPALEALDDAALRHVPFAASVMINRTLEEVLADARQQITSRMVVRVPGFVLPPVQLPKVARATKQRLQGQAALGYPDITRDSIGERREKMLRKFETGGTKQAKDPDFPIAIPTEALRSNFSQLVPRAMYPTNLRLAPRKQPDGSTLLAKRRGLVRTLEGQKIGVRARKGSGLEGIGGTFTLNDENGRFIGIFQRTGRSKRDVRMIWKLRQRITIPDLLDFFDRAERTIVERAPINWDGAIALALRTATPRK